ncbi:acetyl-coenzyme-A carboxylase [Serendipita sp. 397]|nr:acetyl-coenzyme-A carboxylase [Serendipita sp. 397]
MAATEHQKVAHFIGGNSLDVAPPGRVRDFVTEHGGHTVITKVLIANNGIAAVKEIRSVRQWSYETFGSERAIEFTVMATPEDLKVNAEYIRMADRYVEVPGGTNNNNYANVDFIVDVAERSGVHAVWAGWGHASENPKLPESLAASKHKIVFIGPPVEEGLDRAEKIGYPVMIKASEGGGGKGIRKVESPETFKNAFGAVAGEVPGSPIFIMKLAGSARHLEVQLLADQYGNAISLFGRDCSVQRRHQKIIEEAPVTIATPDVFEEMEKAAVRLSKLVGYVSAGTVEYLYSPADNTFCFLELNPRLQVEHPTTEIVSGVNLPAAQLQVAMGLPLHRIRDIRQLYGLAPHGSNEIDFEFSRPDSSQHQRKPQPKGHVVAVRITAENPDAGFKPSSGSLQELNFRSSTNVWGYFSVNSAGGLHEFADSQFGHIFAYGGDREESRKNMVVALKELSIRGDFRTTVEYLIKLLETSAFTENIFTTGWLDTLISENLTAERPDSTLAVICGAVTKAHVASEACWSEYRRILDKGQVPARDTIKTVFRFDFIYEGVRYPFTATRSSLTTWSVYLNGGRTTVGARPLADGGLLVLLDGKSHSVYWREEVGAVRLMIDAKTCLIEQENDPTQLLSPSPGKLVRFLVESGDHLRAGDTYAEIEVMKMYMPLVASEDGVPTFIKQAGVSLEPGDVIGILELDDPTRVKHAKPFEGQLPPLGAPTVVGSKPHQVLASNLSTLHNILDGFDNQNIMNSTLKELLEVLRSPELPYSDANAILSTLSGRMPPKLDESIRSAIERASTGGQEFPAARIKKLIEAHLADLKPQDRTMTRSQLAALIDVAERFRHGLKAHEWLTIASLLSRYEQTEKLFGGDIEARVLKLREEHKDDLNVVAQLVLSHIKAPNKNKLILALLDLIKEGGAAALNPETTLTEALTSLAALESRSTNPVSLKAREVLILCQLPSYDERAVQMEAVLKQSASPAYYGEFRNNQGDPNLEVLKELTDSRWIVFDVLPTFFSHSDTNIIFASLAVYVRRAYRAYSVLTIDYEEGDGMDDGDAPHVVTWRFKLGQSSSPPSTPRINEQNMSKHRQGSVSDLSYLILKNETQPLRTGAMASFPDLQALRKGFDKIVGYLPSFDPSEGVEPPNVLNIALRVFNEKDDLEDTVWREKFLELSNERKEIMNEHGVRRVSFMLCRKGQYPWYFTLREMGEEWKEEEAIRNIEPALAYQLELSRLSNYKITPCFADARQVHIYHAVGRENVADQRFFIRALVRPGRLPSSMRTAEFLISETDRLVGAILDALEVVSNQYRNTDCNHISMNFVYNLNVGIEEVHEAIAGFLERHGKRLWRLHVTGAEVRITLEDEEGNVTPIRAIIDSTAGFIVTLHTYQEITTDRGHTILKSIGDKGPLHLQPVNTPYSTKEGLQPKRYQAHIVGTTYVYDFPDLFAKSAHNIWVDYKSKNPSAVIPKDILSSRELVMDEHGGLEEVDRAPGSNSCGMVAWMFNVKTPEYPDGRRLVVVANDITFRIGSFGPKEDDYFYLASQYARKHGVPRIYLSANSGARIGVAEEVLNLFSCAWNTPGQPEKGVNYLYLTPEAESKLREMGGQSVRTQEIEDEGETRYKITDIIGLQDGLGVECLKGSGLIAGETSRAYDDIFTITLVTARSVGIGAYLVRLGQRAVQVEGQPIILTGAPALNKVLGREVYTSNLQLGGTQIMYKNGVSHMTAGSDLEGATHILRWLSYVPEHRSGPLPVTVSRDAWDRDIDYVPPKGPYDPRWFIEGKRDEISSEWMSGFFDEGSFQETLSGWAQTVVVGRARLGGIPMGIIAVETRTIERIVPADPANAASFEQRIMEAGQVWYPNSAHKTAQAIFDFNREQLPLIIFANWRGFSGGQQDMYDEVLKYGSKIVDGLSSYKQPIFVYIVPNGELRGGAWVVLDPSINPTHMQMYADVESRAGVLEPEGIVEIKLRKDKLVALMERTDPTYATHKKASKDSSLSAEERAAATSELSRRESDLMPTYKQIALLYADLHDRTGRMEAKGCAKPVQWKNARRHFHWAVRAQLAISAAVAKLLAASPQMTTEEAKQRVFAQIPQVSQQDDRAVTEAVEGLDLSDVIAQVTSSHLTQQLMALVHSHRKVGFAGLVGVVNALTDEEKAAFAVALQTATPPGS